MYIHAIQIKTLNTPIKPRFQDEELLMFNANQELQKYHENHLNVYSRITKELKTFFIKKMEEMKKVTQYQKASDKICKIISSVNNTHKDIPITGTNIMVMCQKELYTYCVDVRYIRCHI